MKFAAMAISAMALLQQHDAQRDILIEPAAWRRAAIEARGIRNWGHPLRSHSNDIRKLIVPRTHNKLGDSSFSAAGPRLWNDLPPGLRQAGLSFDSFRRSLKTHFFGN